MATSHLTPSLEGELKGVGKGSSPQSVFSPNSCAHSFINTIAEAVTHLIPFTGGEIKEGWLKPQLLQPFFAKAVAPIFFINTTALLTNT